MITTTETSISYTGDGSTYTFSFPYYFLSNSDLQASIFDPTTGLTQNLSYAGGQYGVSGAGNPSGGSLTLNLDFTAGQILTISRVLAIINPDTYDPNTALPTDILERDFDRLTMICQQLNQNVTVLQNTAYAGDFSCSDASNGGATPTLLIQPGNYRDSTGGATYYPFADSTNNQTALTQARTKAVGTSDTVLYSHSKIDASTGAITALEGGVFGNIEMLSGTSVPTDTSTDAYQLITNFNVTINNGIASIQVFGGGVSGSQNYQYCGNLPATNGSGHLFNS